MVTASFTRCAKCHGVRHVSELMESLEGQSICQDPVRWEKEKLVSAGSLPADDKSASGCSRPRCQNPTNS